MVVSGGGGWVVVGLLGGSCIVRWLGGWLVLNTDVAVSTAQGVSRAQRSLRTVQQFVPILTVDDARVDCVYGSLTPSTRAAVDVDWVAASSSLGRDGLDADGST